MDDDYGFYDALNDSAPTAEQLEEWDKEHEEWLAEQAAQKEKEKKD